MEVQWTCRRTQVQNVLSCFQFPVRKRLRWLTRRTIQDSLPFQTLFICSSEGGPTSWGILLAPLRPACYHVFHLSVSIPALTYCLYLPVNFRPRPLLGLPDNTVEGSGLKEPCKQNVAEKQPLAAHHYCPKCSSTARCNYYTLRRACSPNWETSAGRAKIMTRRVKLYRELQVAHTLLYQLWSASKECS